MNGLVSAGGKHNIRVESSLSEEGDANGYGRSYTTIKLYIDDELIDTKTTGSGTHYWMNSGFHNYSQEIDANRRKYLRRGEK